MTDLRKAAEMALEALEEINKLSIGENAICLPGEIDGAMKALRQALAMEKFSKVNQEIEEALKQPKWVGLEDEDVATVKNEFNRGALWAEQVLKEKNKREWVGLTDEELKALCDEWQIIYGGYVRPFAETIETKLKEKNNG